MYFSQVTLEANEVYKLLSAGSGDAALILLSLRSGCPEDQLSYTLKMSDSRFRCAVAVLRQLQLWPEAGPGTQLVGERPNYSEQDVTDALTRSPEFSILVGEVQRTLGRVLTTEELKIFLSFQRYLGLPIEVIQLLVSYCADRSRKKNGRLPSIRSMEKEAYRWAERNVDSMEEAAAYIRAQNAKDLRLEQLKRLLQIQGRGLTAAEQRYADSWLEMGFEMDAITLAYEKTCLNTGGLKWPYMNKILQSWHAQNLHTADAVKNGDKKPAAQRPAPTRTPDEGEKEAIARMLRED